MKIKEILDLEKVNTGIVNLIKEGLFWRAYEFSAFAFTRVIKPFKATKRFYKNAGEEVVYIGFPENSLTGVFELCKQNGFSYEKINDSLIGISGFINIIGFSEWKNSIEIKAEADDSDNYESIIQKIIKFPLISKTPFEAQKFLLDIQNELNGHT